MVGLAVQAENAGVEGLRQPDVGIGDGPGRVDADGAKFFRQQAGERVLQGGLDPEYPAAFPVCGNERNGVFRRPGQNRVLGDEGFHVLVEQGQDKGAVVAEVSLDAQVVLAGDERPEVGVAATPGAAEDAVAIGIGAGTQEVDGRTGKHPGCGEPYHQVLADADIDVRGRQCLRVAVTGLYGKVHALHAGRAFGIDIRSHHANAEIAECREPEQRRVEIQLGIPGQYVLIDDVAAGGQYRRLDAGEYGIAYSPGVEDQHRVGGEGRIRICLIVYAGDEFRSKGHGRRLSGLHPGVAPDQHVVPVDEAQPRIHRGNGRCVEGVARVELEAQNLVLASSGDQPQGVDPRHAGVGEIEGGVEKSGAFVVFPERSRGPHRFQRNSRVVVRAVAHRLPGIGSIGLGEGEVRAQREGVSGPFGAQPETLQIALGVVDGIHGGEVLPVSPLGAVVGDGAGAGDRCAEQVESIRLDVAVDVAERAESPQRETDRRVPLLESGIEPVRMYFEGIRGLPLHRGQGGVPVAGSIEDTLLGSVGDVEIVRRSGARGNALDESPELDRPGLVDVGVGADQGRVLARVTEGHAERLVRELIDPGDAAPVAERLAAGQVSGEVVVAGSEVHGQGPLSPIQGPGGLQVDRSADAALDVAGGGGLVDARPGNQLGGKQVERNAAVAPFARQVAVVQGSVGEHGAQAPNGQVVGAEGVAGIGKARQPRQRFRNAGVGELPDVFRGQGLDDLGSPALFHQRLAQAAPVGADYQHLLDGVHIFQRFRAGVFRGIRAGVFQGFRAGARPGGIIQGAVARRLDARFGVRPVDQCRERQQCQCENRSQQRQKTP